MSLSVCSSSTDDVFTTTAYVKALLGTTATSDDATISSLIRAASRWAENYVGYPLSVQSYSETVPGRGRRRLLLERTPLRAVARVYEGTDTGTAEQLDSSDFVIDSAEAGFLARDRGFGWTAPLMGRMFESAIPMSLTPLAGQETRPWLVDYVAGYTYGGIDTGSTMWSTEKGTTSTGRTLPEDIEHAVALKAIAYYEGDDEVVSEQLGDLRVQYRSERLDDEAPSLPEKLLLPYRRV